MLCRQRDRGVQLGNRVGVFAADVDIALPRSDRVGGNRHALDQLERIAFHQHPVGKGAAIAFVGVADHVFAGAGSIRNGLPLDARREACAAAAAQARCGDFGQHFGCRHRAGAGQAGPAGGRDIVAQTGRAGAPGAGEGQPLLPGDEGVIGDAANRLG